MELRITDPTQVEILVRWLEDHVAPGRFIESWRSVSNGRWEYASRDGTSWHLVYNFMGGHVQVEGIDQETWTMMMLSVDIR